MIEDIWMSWWTMGIKLSVDSLASWKLSTALAAKWWPRVHLVTDSAGASALKGLPFTSVSTALDDLDVKAHKRMWSLGKIETIAIALKEKKPFLHIDGDVFFWRKLSENHLKTGILVQSEEPPRYFSHAYIPELLMERLGHVPADFKLGATAWNCGIMGGTDLEFWDRYVQGVRELVLHPLNKSFWAEGHAGAEVTTAEQYFLDSVAVQMGKTVTPLLRHGLEQGSRDYSHLALLKKDPEIMARVLARVAQEPYDLEPRHYILPKKELIYRRETCLKCEFRNAERNECTLNGVDISELTKHGFCRKSKW